MDRTLLLVDDEENILNSLARLFRRDGYRILTAQGGEAGLEVLKSNPVGVIISDQRMPQMSGVEFLRQVNARYPDTIRIVLSGYTDLKSVTEAINEGAIYKFLTKPWDDELLRANVAEAFHRYELVHENERLGSALKTVNEELRIANETLAASAAQRSRDGAMNLRTLQVMQDMLEHMPFGVLGIADDEVIAVANGKANEFLGRAGAGLLGSSLRDVLAGPIADCYAAWTNGGPAHAVIDVDAQTYEIWIAGKGQFSLASGSMLVMLPRGGSGEKMR